MNPLVTIVTPVYNAMPYLRDYLACLERQTWRPLQVILVDDGSEDGSKQCLLQQKVSLEEGGLEVQILLCPHRGQAWAMNEALPLIRGMYFTWCDADDLLTDDSIEKKVRWLQHHPHIGMVRSNGTVMDGDKGIVLSRSAREADKKTMDIFEALLLDRTYCYAGCYMVKTDLFFACYPDKKMPESPEGQNLQLLLPPASRSLCGFLDEDLHTYCRRGSGHSSKTRSYQDNLQRIRNFTALRLAILGYCSCDRIHFEEKIRQLEEQKRKQLIFSALQMARKEMGT